MSEQEANTLSIVGVRSPQACRPVNRKCCLMLTSPQPRKDNSWSPRLLSFPSFVTLMLSLKIHFSLLFVLIAPFSAFSYAELVSNSHNGFHFHSLFGGLVQWICSKMSFGSFDNMKNTGSVYT